MNHESMYEATLARQRELIDEAARRQLSSSGSSKSRPALRITLATWLRRMADRVEPAASFSR